MRRALRTGFAAVLLLLSAAPLPVSLGAASGAPAHLARLDGAIDPITAQYLVRAVDRAEREGAAVLIVVLDTPGGLDSAMRTITQRMLVARVPIVVYVAPSGARAASAGVFLTLAAHVAAMAPGTNIGAAHPVAAGGGALDPTMAAKMANDAAATARTLAVQRGRNADWADRAVRESVSATEAEALADGVVDLVARDLDDLLEQIDRRAVTTADGARTIATRGAPRIPIEMTVAELFLHTLLNPNVAFLLLNLGFLGLIAELYHPGTLVPGLVGVIGVVLGLVALGTLPVNWAAVGLLLLAFGLFLADLHVAGHGALSVAGLVAFVLGGLLLFSPIETPPWRLDELRASPWRVSPWLLGGTALLCAGYVAVILRAALGARRLGPARGLAPGAGDVAVALTDLVPAGVVRLGHEEWSATAESGDVRAGEVVEVVGREGLRLRVRRRPAGAISGGAGGTGAGSAATSRTQIAAPHGSDQAGTAAYRPRQGGK
ncbi:MAG TPA: nodulation protein NfeD [Chloroflexota bacterium]|nr:nodulation protein NfeD [Chloroflexota bacterium]